MRRIVTKMFIINGGYDIERRQTTIKSESSTVF